MASLCSAGRRPLASVGARVARCRGPATEETRLCPVRTRRTTGRAPTDRRSPTPMPGAHSGSAGFPPSPPVRLSGAAAAAAAVSDPRRRLLASARWSSAGGRRSDRRDRARLARGAPTATAGAFSDATANVGDPGLPGRAGSNRDTETIARNALCGIYDAVRRPPIRQALAKLSSDAFRKQFSRGAGDVDRQDRRTGRTIRPRCCSPCASSRPPAAAREVEAQGVAQLLSQHNQILVCSYVLRTRGQF